MVDLAVLGYQLDSVILRVFSSLNDSSSHSIIASSPFDYHLIFIQSLINYRLSVAENPFC